MVIVSLSNLVVFLGIGLIIIFFFKNLLIIIKSVIAAGLYLTFLLTISAFNINNLTPQK